MRESHRYKKRAGGEEDRERERERKKARFRPRRIQKSTATNWLSGAIVGGGGENRGKKRALSRVRAHIVLSSSIFFYSSSEPVTNGRQLKLDRPRAFKRRRFRSHVRNESSGTRIDASVAQKDVEDEARRAAASLREAYSETRFKAVWAFTVSEALLPRVSRDQKPRTWRLAEVGVERSSLLATTRDASHNVTGISTLSLTEMRRESRSSDWMRWKFEFLPSRRRRSSSRAMQRIVHAEKTVMVVVTTYCGLSLWINTCRVNFLFQRFPLLHATPTWRVPSIFHYATWSAPICQWLLAGWNSPGRLPLLDTPLEFMVVDPTPGMMCRMKVCLCD